MKIKFAWLLVLVLLLPMVSSAYAQDNTIHLPIVSNGSQPQTAPMLLMPADPVDNVAGSIIVTDTAPIDPDDAAHTHLHGLLHLRPCTPVELDFSQTPTATIDVTQLPPNEQGCLDTSGVNVHEMQPAITATVTDSVKSSAINSVYNWGDFKWQCPAAHAGDQCYGGNGLNMIASDLTSQVPGIKTGIWANYAYTNKIYIGQQYTIVCPDGTPSNPHIELGWAYGYFHGQIISGAEMRQYYSYYKRDPQTGAVLCDDVLLNSYGVSRQATHMEIYIDQQANGGQYYTARTWSVSGNVWVYHFNHFFMPGWNGWANNVWVGQFAWARNGAITDMLVYMNTASQTVIAQMGINQLLPFRRVDMLANFQNDSWGTWNSGATLHILDVCCNTSFDADGLVAQID